MDSTKFFGFETIKLLDRVYTVYVNMIKQKEEEERLKQEKENETFKYKTKTFTMDGSKETEEKMDVKAIKQLFPDFIDDFEDLSLDEIQTVIFTFE